MVDIDFIKTNSCPVCGCQTVSLESVEVEFDSKKIRRHCNGGTWETREFACGFRVMYIPNFHHEEVIRYCSFDPEIAKQKELAKQIKDKIMEQIDRAGCDENYKEKLRKAIEYA